MLHHILSIPDIRLFDDVPILGMNAAGNLPNYPENVVLLSPL